MKLLLVDAPDFNLPTALAYCGLCGGFSAALYLHPRQHRRHGTAGVGGVWIKIEKLQSPKQQI
jgi:hypothetical protein